MENPANSENIYVKRLEPQDWKLWKDIRLEALTTNPESFGGAFEEDIQKDDRYWMESLENHHIYGVFQAEKLVSTAGFTQLSAQKLAHRGEIFAVFTKTQARQKGYSRLLMQKIMSFAKKHVKQIHLNCSTANESALIFYQSMGFTIYGTEPNALYVHNQFYDQYLLVNIF